MKALRRFAGVLAIALVGLAAGLAVAALTRNDPARPPEEAAGRPTPALPVAVKREPALPASASPTPAGIDSLEGVEIRWVEKNNEATELLAGGELGLAVGLFEQCFEAQPERNVFRKNLAEALVRLARREHDERELDAAIAHLERALGLVPEREDADVLRTVLERWKDERELEADHWTESSDVFVLSYDTSRTDILQHAQDVLAFLEGVYEDLRLWFRVDPVRAGGEPFRVVLYDREAFDRITGLGDWAGGVFDGDIRVSVENLATERANWQRVLRHEFVHAYIHAVGGTEVPGWLNEGLAQWLETDPGLAAANARLAAAVGAGLELYPLETLQGSLAAWDDADEIALAYAQSLAIVSYVARQWGEGVLLALVRAPAQGRSVAEVFEERTGVPLSFVLEDLPNYL